VSIRNVRGACAMIFIPEVSVSSKTLRQTLVRSVSAAAILSAAVASPVVAQDTMSVDKRNGWSISIGADPTQRTGSPVFSENLFAGVAREWARPNIRLGFRTQLTAGILPATYASIGDFESGRVLKQRKSFVELSAATTYTFRRNRNFSPYLLAGPALYAIRSSHSVTNAVIGDPGDAFMEWSYGATAGAGVSFKLLGKDMLLEQRILTLPTSTGRLNRVVRPFTLGIRF
jgi:opacity protein-like surface antigen